MYSHIIFTIICWQEVFCICYVQSYYIYNYLLVREHGGDRNPHTDYALYIAVLDLSGASTSKIVFCTFHTSRSVPAVVFRMFVFLTAHALGYYPFGMWRFEFYYRV
jgi:hypothetical protein